MVKTIIFFFQNMPIPTVGSCTKPFVSFNPNQNFMTLQIYPVSVFTGKFLLSFLFYLLEFCIIPCNARKSFENTSYNPIMHFI